MIEVLQVIYWLIMIGVSASLLALIHRDIKRDREFLKQLEEIKNRRER